MNPIIFALRRPITVMVGIIAVALTAFVAVRPKAFDVALAKAGIELPLKRMPIDIFPALNLPVIYVVENNQYAMGTSIKRSSAEPELFRRGQAHRIPGLQVDGMDVLAVRGAAEVALEWTRGGKGPILIEFLTYRYRGHSMSDPAKYRTREEVQDYREHRDPILHAERDLAALGVTEDALKAIDKEIKDIVVEAAKFAEDAPEPAPSELYTDVLVESY